MKGLEHDAGKAHILAGCYVDALLERCESVAHDAHLVPAGLDRQGHYGRVPDHATVDVELTPRRRPDEQAPHAHNGRASWRRPGSGDASRKPISPAAASAITSAAPSASRRRIRARGPPGSYPSSHNTGGATGGGASGAAGGDTDAGAGAAPAASAATRSRTVAYRSCGSGLRARVSASRTPRGTGGRGPGDAAASKHSRASTAR